MHTHPAYESLCGPLVRVRVHKNQRETLTEHAGGLVDRLVRHQLILCDVDRSLCTDWAIDKVNMLIGHKRVRR